MNLQMKFDSIEMMPIMIDAHCLWNQIRIGIDALPQSFFLRHTNKTFPTEKDFLFFFSQISSNALHFQLRLLRLIGTICDMRRKFNGFGDTVFEREASFVQMTA